MGKKRRWQGFTLIEITAVAGIISTLSVGTYMGVQKGRERECINNLQQIYKAIVMFEMDNNYLPNAKFFPSSSSDPKGLNNILIQYGVAGTIFYCPSIPEQLNRYGTNYIWNDTTNNRTTDSLPPNTWLMTEMTAVSKNIPGPHTGRFSILYAGGNAQTGERVYFPDVAPVQPPPEEKRETVVEKEKTIPAPSPQLTLLTKKEALAGEEVKISVIMSDGKGGSLQIQPGMFSISTDDPSVTIPSSFEVKSPTSSFDFISVFKKTGKVHIKVKEENSGIEGGCEINILPETTSQFLFSVFPTLWEAGKPQAVHIIACDTTGNKTDDYNGEAVLLIRKGKVSPEKISIAKGRWMGEITINQYSESNVLYVAGERGIVGVSPEFKVKNTTPSSIDVYPEDGVEPVAGIPYNITLEVKDMYGNRCIDYTGEIEIGLPEGATTDTKKILLGPEDKGKKIISIIFFKAENKRIQCFGKDIKGEKEIYVNPGQLYGFSIGEIGTQEAGKAFSIIVKATDRWGNTVKGYYLKEPAGCIEYVNRDTSSGMWMETVVIRKAGQYTLFIEGMPGIIGRSNTFTVRPSSAEKIEITGLPIELFIGKEYSGSIIVKDRFDNIITDYIGNFTVQSEGLTTEINETNIRLKPEKKGYYKLTLKDEVNNKLFVEKYFIVLSEK